MGEDALVIGEAGPFGPLRLDLGQLIGQHLGIVANSGGGKSGLIRKLLEVTHGRIQHIILDSEDEFYTLRERFDYVIAGGDGGDTPATIGNAGQLALAALEHGFSLICQINDLGRAGANDFIDQFLEAMIGAPKSLWHPCLVVIDEVQRFDETAIGRLTAEGRKRNFTAVLATQRLPKMDPNVRGDLNNWIMGRVGQSLDRRHMADQLGMPPREARELATIQPREFYAFGPALTREPTVFRVGDVETTMVRPGEARVAALPPPEALREILAALAPPPAEQPPAGENMQAEASEMHEGRSVMQDPALVARIADLETERASLREINERKNARIAQLERDLADARLTINEAITTLGGVLPLIEVQPEPVVVQPEQVVGEYVDENRVIQRTALERPAAEPNGKIGPERVALAALAGVYPSGLTESQWATRAGYKRGGGTWKTYRSRLRTAGLVVQRDGRWFATPHGCEQVGDVETPPGPGPELIRWWSGRLSGVGPMAEALIAAWPNWMTREQLGERIAMEPSGGSFKTYVSRLAGPELIERDKDRGIRLNPAMMGAG